ncbi:MAG: zinc ribbon domain-containing protein [Syntrophaceae bacterium]|nr:zinc ribbon domain-containing protein [Syntrophaceae bacterium]
MPIYEYRCDKCGKEFEAWQKFSDAPIETCECCGGHASKLISQSSFILKGSGWYVTDYGNKHTCSTANPKSSAKDESSKSSCETKPAESKTCSSCASSKE